MGIVSTSIKYVIAQIISTLLTLAIIAAPIVGFIMMDAEQSTTVEGLVNEASTLILDGGIAAVGGTLLIVLILFLLISLFVTGFVAQTLWGWDKHHSYKRTGLKFVFIGFIAGLVRDLGNFLLDGIFRSEYASFDAFMTAFNSGSSEAYALAGAYVGLFIVGFLLIGVVARLFGWE